MMWHGLKVEVLSLNYRPLHRYVDMSKKVGPLKVSSPTLVIVCFSS